MVTLPSVRSGCPSRSRSSWWTARGCSICTKCDPRSSTYRAPGTCRRPCACPRPRRGRRSCRRRRPRHPSRRSETRSWRRRPAQGACTTRPAWSGTPGPPARRPRGRRRRREAAVPGAGSDRASARTAAGSPPGSAARRSWGQRAWRCRARAGARARRGICSGAPIEEKVPPGTPATANRPVTRSGCCTASSKAVFPPIDQPSTRGVRPPPRRRAPRARPRRTPRPAVPGRRAVGAADAAMVPRDHAAPRSRPAAAPATRTGWCRARCTAAPSARRRRWSRPAAGCR